jgi:hypothetical protein
MSTKEKPFKLELSEPEKPHISEFLQPHWGPREMPSNKVELSQFRFA